MTWSRAVAAVLVTLGVSLAAGCAEDRAPDDGAASTPSTPSTPTLTGRVRIPTDRDEMMRLLSADGGSVDQPAEEDTGAVHSGCVGAKAGYEDIHEGTTVDVVDTAGEVIGTTELTEPGTVPFPDRGTRPYCVFSFEVTLEETPTTPIGVRIGSERRAQYATLDELARAGWAVDLSVGL